MASSARSRLALALLVALGLGVAWLALPWRGEEAGDSREGQENDAPAADRSDATLRAIGRRPSPETPEPPQPATPSVSTRLGTARVHVTDEEGRAVDFAGRIYIFWRALGTNTPWGRQGVPAAQAIGGVARFTDVRLGMELRFRSEGGTRWFSGEVVVTGPRLAGEEVEAHLRLGPEKPTVSAIALDEEARVLAKVKLSVGFALVDADAPPGSPPDRRPIQMRWCTTDENGRFKQLVSIRAPAGKRTALFVELDDMNRGVGEVIHRATVPLDDGLPGGEETELGPVRLEPTATERLLVQGVVVDEDGGPIQGAWISAGYHPEPRRGWRPLHRMHIRSDRQGHFEIRTTLEEPAAYKVSASVHDRAPETIEVKRGTRNIVLRLVQGGQLRASFRWPEGVPWTLLEGVIRREGRESGGAPNQAMGKFGYDHLRPGRYDVIVRIKSTSWELARISGVLVRQGERADDARIRNIDIEGRCRLMKMVVRGPDGAPLVRKRVTVRDAEGKGGSVRTDAKGRAVMVVPSAVSLFQVKSGELTAEVAWGPDEQEILLAPR